MSGPRAYTAEECRNMFLERVRGIAKYWSELEGKTDFEKCDGVAFSIMALIDGSNIDIPMFDLRAHPHPDDRRFNLDNGENWWPKGIPLNAEPLHEHYHDDDHRQAR